MNTFLADIAVRSIELIEASVRNPLDLAGRILDAANEAWKMAVRHGADTETECALLDHIDEARAEYVRLLEEVCGQSADEIVRRLT